MERAVQQDTCRIGHEMFHRRKVFNTSVDKFVEINAPPSPNLPLLNILSRFALLLCNFSLPRNPFRLFQRFQR
jgi:hypothetical protein